MVQAEQQCKLSSVFFGFYLVGIGLGEDVLDGLLDAVDLVGILIGDLNAELFLNGHDDLDGVERIKTEVVGKVCLLCDVARVVDLVKPAEELFDPLVHLGLLETTTRGVPPHNVPAGDLGDKSQGGRGAGDGSSGCESGRDSGGADGRPRRDGGGPEDDGSEHFRFGLAFSKIKGSGGRRVVAAQLGGGRGVAEEGG